MKIKKLIEKLTKKTTKIDLILIIVFICIFIFIRTVYYKNLFVFIYDQVSSSTKALELWQTKSISLIGPPISIFQIFRREMYFGGISYYIQLIFLLLGNFDPFRSTYAFMLFSAIMIIPLYFGVKKMINLNAAILMSVAYCLFPLYIEATYMLWNPNFQFALLPLFLYLMSIFEYKKSGFLFFFLAIYSGILFQLHYLFIFVIVGLIIYYFLLKKLPLKFLSIALIGFIIGFSPIIIFELRHNFYNLRTIILYLNNRKQLFSHWVADYYFLSSSFFGLIILLKLIKKRIKTWLIVLVFCILAILSYEYVNVDAQTRQYPKGWFYADELRAYSIIKNNYLNNKIQDFNIFEFFDATGNAQKYYLKRDGIKINFEDYRNNKYLYVIYHNNQFMKDMAYEINEFQPSIIVKEWKINDRYKMYLLKRLESTSQ